MDEAIREKIEQKAARRQPPELLEWQRWAINDATGALEQIDGDIEHLEAYLEQFQLELEELRKHREGWAVLLERAKEALDD